MRHDGLGRRRGRAELRDERIEIKDLLDGNLALCRRGWRGAGRFHLLLNLADRVLEVDVVLRELQRTAIVHEGLAHQAAALIDLREGADRRQVARRRIENSGQFGERLVEAVELDEGAAQRDAGGEVIGMVREAGAADLDGFVVGAVAAQLFRELRKRHRRRVRLDPASEVEESRIVGGHGES